MSINPFHLYGLRFPQAEGFKLTRLGILQVHVRSGPLLNAYGTELTRDCSIKVFDSILACM